MDKLVYALNLIVDFIDMNDRVSEGAITDYLFFTGFDDYEIRQILALLDMNGHEKPDNFRIFSRSERQAFGSDAVNYLNKLLLSGVLDFVSLEEIIEKTELKEPYKITVDQIKELTLLTLLEKKAEIYRSAESGADYAH